MKVLFFCRKMPDLCGAFLHDVDLALELLKRGHQVVFMTIHTPPEGYNGGYWQGFRFMHYSAGSSFLDSSDVWICPHSPILPDVRKLNRRGYNRPIVATCHFDGNYNAITGQIPPRVEWVEMVCFINRVMEPQYRKNIRPWPSQIVRTETVRPILHREKICFEGGPRGEYITLINANLNKGVHQFVGLARAMPDRKFLGILPYYGEKNLPPCPENIKWIPFQDDVRDVLKDTRILLVPSYYESFGRVAIEAMINGIPVIYSRPVANSVYPGGSTEGLEEWIRPAGIGLPRDATSEWADAVRALDDPEAYAQKSEESREHVESMNLFGEGTRIAEMVEGFSRQHPVVKKSSTAIEPARNSGTSQTPQVVAVPREPVNPGRAGFGFSNGRLKIQR
jgi:glycosyltransferase involved in cell wall biosynthesis